MIFGLEKLWGSGSSAGTAAPTATSTLIPVSSSSQSRSQTSSQAQSTVPLLTASVPVSEDLTSSHKPSEAAKTVFGISADVWEEQDNSWLSARSRKQFALFAAGATFLLLTTRYTQRTVAKRTLQMTPKFYRPSNAGPEVPVNGPMEALEALTIATLNVSAFTMMISGGLLWAFDVSSINDLRRKIRGGLGVDGSGRSVEQVEEEFEEWVATMLDRKQRKEQAKAGGLGIADNEEVQREWQNEKSKVRSF